MLDDKTPRVFISYSWSSEAMAIPLAERLVSHGVDVVFDKWDLKEGQDKYSFMEQCVNDPSISKVLILSDRAYMEKANARAGGVGDETVIISSEVYGNTKQEKFIPIIVERDEQGEPYLPTYIKSRIYIDLSSADHYEEEYEKLLRNIYEKPLFRKPALGSRPNWLDEEDTNLFPLTDLIRQIKGAKTDKRVQSCVNSFVEMYISAAKKYRDPQVKTASDIFGRFVKMKPLRDVFLDFLPVLNETELSFSNVICDAFEKMHNTLTCAKGFDPNAFSAREYDYDIFKIHIWELFICMIAYLRHIEDYKTINAIITNTYFLTKSSLSDSIEPRTFCSFYHYSSAVEDQYKPTTDKKNLYTIVGDMVCTEREKLPIFTGRAIADADLFLYQIKNAFDFAGKGNYWGDNHWFPICYVYASKNMPEWVKMQSRKHCLKMFLLFGVSSIDELKSRLKKCVYDSHITHYGCHYAAPAILSCIKLEDIGVVN